MGTLSQHLNVANEQTTREDAFRAVIDGIKTQIHAIPGIPPMSMTQIDEVLQTYHDNADAADKSMEKPEHHKPKRKKEQAHAEDSEEIAPEGE